MSAVEAAAIELEKARSKFAKFNSAHEGFAVLKEEVDELWDEVKRNPGHGKLSQKDHLEQMRKEAIQVAAMALRFVEDICDAKKEAPPSAERAAEWALKQLGKEDLIYQHHGEICVRPAGYQRLGEMIEAYAKQRS